MPVYKSNRLIKIIIFSLIVFFEILFPVYLTKLIDGETPNLPYLELIPVILFDSLWVFVSYVAGRYSDLNINKPGYLNKLLSISSINEDLMSIKIYDMTGKLIYEKFANSQKEVVNLSKISNGIYTLIIETHNHLKHLKFMRY